MTPRITPGTRGDIGTANWIALQVGGRAAGTGVPNLFATLARNRGLFRGWLWFASKLMPRGTLPRRDTELAILRTAARNGCAYEIDHHRRIGAQAGLTPAEVNRATGLETDGWSGRDAVLIRAIDQLCEDGNLDDPTWAALRTHLDEKAAIEFVLLVGHYSMLATFINTIGVELDH
jgi:AhpD family alkylhydroperoxidase